MTCTKLAWRTRIRYLILTKGFSLVKLSPFTQKTNGLLSVLIKALFLSPFLNPFLPIHLPHHSPSLSPSRPPSFLPLPLPLFPLSLAGSPPGPLSLHIIIQECAITHQQCICDMHIDISADSISKELYHVHICMYNINTWPIFSYYNVIASN